MSEAGSYTRVISGFTGVAGLYIGSQARFEWQIADLHGDVVATVLDGSAGLAATYTLDEYGNASTPGPRYGYLGNAQRSADNIGGFVTMGARLYNPSTGRFLSVDPIYGGNANSYIYPTDPVNRSDPSGLKEVDDGGYSNSCKCTSKNKKWQHYTTTSWSTSRWMNTRYNNLPYHLRSIVKESIARWGGFTVVTIDSMKYQLRTRYKVYRRCKGGQWQYRWDEKQQERVRTVLSIVFWGDQTITSRWGSGGTG
ncbi:RHS repeat-associated core domain-containing protein [Micromonospora sp. NPDC005171]|uniref:RHS repeat-associated core domain-containing protein n=1 Tax=Micromonospora sp. NPDC005171 TaxID=3156866 RepID=UPI0033A38063